MTAPRSQLPAAVVCAYWREVKKTLVAKHGLRDADADRGIANYRRVGAELGIGDIQYHDLPTEAAKGIVNGKYATRPDAVQTPASLPRLQDLFPLPRRARVTLVARSGQRVLPITDYAAPERSRSQRLEIEMVLAGAADYAAAQRAEASFWLDDRSSPVERLCDAVSKAVEAARNSTRPDGTINSNEDVELMAGPYPELDRQARAFGRFKWRFVHAAETAVFAVEVAATIARQDPVWEEAVVAAIRWDYDALARQAEANSWTDDTPVPVELLGPLWPGAVPPSWPVTDDELA